MKDLKADKILFELLSPFGFKGNQIEKIRQALSGQAGKQFTSNAHQLIKDREELIIQPIAKKNRQNSVLMEEEVRSFQGVSISIKKKEEIDFKIDENPRVAQLDYDKLTFPLTIRKWEKGDVFIPLGMVGKKKLSDYFTDKKMSLFEKEKVRVLVSNGEIVWIINHRINDHYKITPGTDLIYQMITEE